MSDTNLVMVYIWGCITAGIIGFLIGGISATSSARNKAIEAGVAEYRCDAQTGDCEFRFITEE